MTVLAASLLSTGILIFPTWNRKSVNVTLFLHIYHYFSVHPETPPSIVKKYQNPNSILKFCLHWIQDILLELFSWILFTSPFYSAFALWMFLACLFFFPFICSFEVLMRISLTLQVCSVTVTKRGKSVFYQNNVEKFDFIYWKSILDDLKAAIWFQLHPINARQNKELSP